MEIAGPGEGTKSEPGAEAEAGGRHAEEGDKSFSMCFAWHFEFKIESWGRVSSFLPQLSFQQQPFFFPENSFCALLSRPISSFPIKGI